MNNMEQKQQEVLHLAFANVSEGRELPDEALDAVAGGTQLTGHFFLVTCICGWSAAYDGKNKYDELVVVHDHIETNKEKKRECPGAFSVFEFNKPVA